MATKTKSNLAEPSANGAEEHVLEEEPQAASRYILMLLQGQDGSSIGQPMVAELRRRLEDTISEPPENVEIDVWLESPGGDAHAAYKLALVLRAHCSVLRVVVPDYAKSAATLLSLAADEIYMGPGAELGPLDAQIPNEQGGIISTISALDIARSLEDLTQLGMSMAISGGGLVLQTTRLSRSESLTAMLDFSAKFLEPIVRQLDPAMIHWASTLLKVAEDYGERLLKTRNEATQLKYPHYRRLSKSLVEDYPTHGFVIGCDEARDTGLPVFDLREYDSANEAVSIHRSFEDDGTSLLELVSLDDLLVITSVEDGERDDDDAAEG